MGKRLIIAALAVAGALGTGLAQARSNVDVQWSVTIGNGGVGVYGDAPVYGPAPVYTPAPVYEPAPVYMPAPVYRTVPVPVYTRPVNPRWGYVHPTRWDRDGDGVPNRWDRHDNRRDDHGRANDRDHGQGRHDDRRGNGNGWGH